MLVLSRRLNERIVIPAARAVIQIVGVKANAVRLGIEAPPEVAVLREELCNPAELVNTAVSPAAEALRRLSHAARNRLNATAVGLGLLRAQLAARLNQKAEETLGKVEREIEALRQQLETAEQAAPKPRRRRALLVEDDANECELLAAYMRMAGLEVTTAGDGADALDHLRREGRPDVLLLDMLLPRCDGPTVLRELRSNPAYRGLKVFAVSGHEPAYFGLDRESLVDRWFRKPLDPAALVREVNRELDKGA